MRIYPELVIPASLLTLFFCLIAGYNSCKTVFKIMPSEAMKPKSPQIGKKILLERVKKIWTNINNTWKIIFRNIFRHKRRALLTSTGVIFSTAILIIAISMKDSIDYMIDQQYKNIQDYDIKVSFSKFLNIGELNSIKNITGVVKMEPLLETGVEVQKGWKKKVTGLTAIVREPEMYRAVDKSGNPVDIPDRGIVIPERLAEELEIELNDRVFVKPLLPGKDKIEVPVKGIAMQYLGMSTYTPLEDVNYIIREGVIANSAVLKLENDSFEDGVKKSLKDMPAVRSVQSKSDSLDALMENMAAMTSSIGVMILLAAVLSIAVVYNTATINIFERQRELATLKVLGFKENEIKKLIFNENYIITVFGLIVGLPFGSWLGIYMMATFTTDFYSFPFMTKPWTYVISAALTIVFTMAANMILMKKIKSINIAEVLKSRE
jgi:putative ABC transport system permease protein